MRWKLKRRPADAPSLVVESAGRHAASLGVAAHLRAERSLLDHADPLAVSLNSLDQGAHSHERRSRGTERRVSFSAQDFSFGDFPAFERVVSFDSNEKPPVGGKSNRGFCVGASIETNVSIVILYQFRSGCKVATKHVWLAAMPALSMELGD